MGYSEALEAAGANIIAMEQFGSYQGDWWCLCEYKGEVGWVMGSFGSCSGCDAFEAEFGWTDNERPDYQSRLKEFGLTYLNVLMPQDQSVKEASSNLSWDDSVPEMVKFIKEEWEKYHEA